MRLLITRMAHLTDDSQAVDDLTAAIKLDSTNEVFFSNRYATDLSASKSLV